jgi:hypothetical protein
MAVLALTGESFMYGFYAGEKDVREKVAAQLADAFGKKVI